MSNWIICTSSAETCRDREDGECWWRKHFREIQWTTSVDCWASKISKYDNALFGL